MTADAVARPDRTWQYVALAFLVGWLVILQFYNPLRSGSPRLLGGGSDLGAADFSWKLQDLEGKPVDFASFKGKPVFLNVWATWCGPCVKEMPSIARLAATIPPNQSLIGPLLTPGVGDWTIKPVRAGSGTPPGRSLVDAAGRRKSPRAERREGQHLRSGN